MGIRAAAIICVVVWFSAGSDAQTVTSLHTFSGGADGANPAATVVSGPKGNLFGTTWYGGLLSCNGGAGCGTIFTEIAPATPDGNWTFSTLYQFTGGDDGCCNSSVLTRREGKLYGVTNGGLPNGSIFELAQGPGGKWQLSLLYTFPSPSIGEYPWTPLLIDRPGAIYAASSYGGLRGCSFNSGCGTVIQLLPPGPRGGGWTERTLYQFRGGSDGGNPSSSLLLINGSLYGSTYVGGKVTSNCPLGCGTIYQLRPTSQGSWTETAIYTFQDKPDGASPYSLVADATGSLYGLACCNGSSSQYNVFKLTLQDGVWSKTVLHDFLKGGANYLTFGSNGILYGTRFGEIDFSAGSVFELSPPPGGVGDWSFKRLVDFNKTGPSRNPNGVVLGKFGELYGTLNGGDSDFGAVFKIK
jgi:hypothetical protein